jgi:hypothetical protein
MKLPAYEKHENFKHQNTNLKQTRLPLQGTSGQVSMTEIQNSKQLK